MPEYQGNSPALLLRHVSATAQDGTKLLDDVSFTAERGSLVAIVGPTGAGKTSLARVLTGALKADAGDVQVAGKVAFVPQHDTLHLGLPLRRGLEYAADLRLRDVDSDERAARVTAVMRELGLEAHADTVVRDLSVGQRKRASVAAQLLGDPDVIVLDEPTAGLDPGYERVVQQMLRSLADAGRTVITVTHSVEALQASDNVLFLAAGGSVAFFGPPAKAARYFKLADAAEVFLALDTEREGSWQERFRATALYKKTIAEPVAEAAPIAPAPISRAGQIRMLMKRHFDMIRGDRRHMALLALQGPIIGGLLWAVLPANGLVPNVDGGFSGKAAVVVLFLVLSTTWLGVTNAVREIVKEQQILRSEVRAGLSPRSYLLSKLFSVGVMTMAQSWVIAFIATGRQHAPTNGAILPSARLELMVIAALAGLVACSLGLVLSAMSKSADKALAMLPMVLVLQLVLAGGWAQESAFAPLRLVRHVVGARWAMEAMAATLRRDPGHLLSILGYILALVAGSAALATWRVAHVTRLANAPRRTARDLVPTFGPVDQRTRRLGIGLATAAAVTLSLGAGGTGLMAIAGHNGPKAPALAAGLAPAKAAPNPVVTTTTAPAPVVVPVTTPTTATPKPKAAVNSDPIPVQTDVSIPTTPPTGNIVTPTPSTSGGGGSVLNPTPVVTPTSTGTTQQNPWSKLFNIFKIFTPQADQ